MRSKSPSTWTIPLPPCILRGQHVGIDAGAQPFEVAPLPERPLSQFAFSRLCRPAESLFDGHARCPSPKHLPGSLQQLLVNRDRRAFDHSYKLAWISAHTSLPSQAKTDPSTEGDAGKRPPLARAGIGGEGPGLVLHHPWNPGDEAGRMAGYSVPDVQCVPERSVDLRTLHFVQTANRLRVQGVLRDVMTLSHVMTQRCGSPSCPPSSTSDRMPRIVRVIGAQVTARRTLIAASRVRMHTGRRPAGGPRSAQ